MINTEMSLDEMRKYLRFYRGEDQCPDHHRKRKFCGACWQAEQIIATRWKSLTTPESIEWWSTKGYKKTIPELIFDWVSDVLGRHTPYTVESDMEYYVTGRFYRDYRGYIYRIIAFANGQKEQNRYVVYKEMFDHGVTWIMPVDEFFETVEKNNEILPRFRLLTDEEALQDIPFSEWTSLGITRVFHGIERPDFTPEHITELRPDEVFVFGSNLDGRHCGGAALYALRHFGAEMGKGVGMSGQSYAIPTMHGGIDDIKPYVNVFIEFAKKNPDKFFYVTRVGCGIAGFEDRQIAPLFYKALDVSNICLPYSFWIEITDRR